MTDTKGIQYYRKLEHARLQRRKDPMFFGSEDEDTLLSEMDEAWWSLTEEEQQVLDQEKEE